ncbi:hypothetical protein BDY24DRAFT_375847 [Mrakia frigida]|uniref:uncharacterized protein n=1 Tax=Mrakia frigida TaxID=29902 RepID=UPI003FCC0613
MTSPPSNLPSTLPGSSASSSRTIRPRDYSNLTQGSSSLARNTSFSPPSSSSSSSLHSSAKELRSRLLGPSSSSRELILRDLPVCLYLLRNLLRSAFPDGRRRASRTRTRKEREDAGLVVDALNELLSSISSSEQDEEEVMDELRAVLVEKWVVEGGKDIRLSALDLLSDTCISQHTSLLSHSVLIELVEGLWSNGNSSSRSSQPTSSPRRVLASLDRLCTPFRLHFLFFASKLLYILLVLALLSHPGSFVSDSQEGRPEGPWDLNWKEVIWVIYSVGFIIEILTTRILVTLTYTLPLLAFLLSLLPSPSLNSLAYPTLTLSLLPLFLSLVSSSSPSLPHLFPSTSLLPLSTYTSSLLTRIAKPSILFLPLALGIFVALAWSLNGDIWRLGIQLAPGTEPPGEIGVAPFAVRLWLAIALVVVLVIWLMVGCSRCYVERGRDGEGERDEKEENASKDPWEEEWGREASRKARPERLETLRRYLVRQSDFKPLHQPPSTTNGNSTSNGASSSESQPLLAHRTPASPSPLPRPTFQPIIPLPSPLNLVTFVLAILPNTLASSLPSSDAASKRRRAELGRWWAGKVELWIWRGVVVVTGLGPWEVVRRARERGRAGR